MKKLVGFILTVCLICPTFVFAAEDGTAAGQNLTGMENVVFELTSLGIVQGDENGNIDISKNLTRAEFVEIVLNLQGLGNAAEQSNFPSQYSDLPEDHWAKNVIMFATEVGIVAGFPGGTFEPDSSILLQDCVKILVTQLGYDVYAEEIGGYPDGYLTAGYEIGLMDDVSGASDQPITFGNMMQMVHNALDIELLQTDSYGEDRTYEKSDDTFRSILMNIETVGMTTGVVTATKSAWLVKPLPDLEDDEVEIGGFIYQIGETNAEDYLGQEVRIYFREDESAGTYTLINIQPLSTVSTMYIDPDDFLGYTADAITYLRNDRETTLALDDLAVVVYNGRPLLNHSEDEIEAMMTFDNGLITCINNDRGGGQDYVFVDAYESGVVEQSYANGRVQFKNGYGINGSNFIALIEDDEMHYQLRNTAGEEVAVTDLAENDVLSLYISEDGMQITGIVSKESITGTSERVHPEDGVMISGEWYELANDALLDEIHIGEEKAFLLNHENKVVYLQDSDEVVRDYHYGYIYRAEETGPWGEYSVQMIQGKQIENEEEYNEDNPDDHNAIPVLVCQNEGLVEYTLREKLRVDHQTTTAEEFIRPYLQGQATAPIRYELNADGLISSIETLDLVGGEPGRTIQYNAYDQTFGGYRDMGGFAIDENTVAICVPTNSDASGDDFEVRLKIDNRDASRTYQAEGYVYDEETKTVELLVVHETMNAGDVMEVNPLDSDIAMVTQAATSLNDDGEEVITVTMLTGGEEVSYVAEDFNGDIPYLSAGDLIYFTENTNGLLSDVQIIESIDYDAESGITNDGMGIEYIFGYVDSISLNDLDVINNQKVHTMQVQVDNGMLSEVLIPARNLPSIYVCGRDSITLGGIEDIMPYAGSRSNKVFVVRISNEVEAIVVVQ